MNTPVTVDAWQALHGARPLAAQLALLTCLPVRVSPALVRLARLRLLPRAGTGEEADLWLSDLVESRSSAGFSYRRAVREQLRRQLAEDPARLDALWHQVHRAQAAWLEPRARREEELTWRLLRDRADPAIDAHWQAVLQSLDSGPDSEGLARWVLRAVPDLPEGALDTMAAWRAWQGAHLMLGDASVLGETPQAFQATTDFGFATRRLPRRRLWVGLLDGALLVSPQRPIGHGHEIELPATRPLWLQLEDETGTPLQVLTIADGTPQQVALGTPGVVLRSIDGAACRLTPPAPAAVASQQSTVRGGRPRVQIGYDLEAHGEQRTLQLPFVIGVLADLVGQPAQPLPDPADRRFLEIDLDNFDARIKALQPRLAFAVPDLLGGEGNLAVDLVFEALGDFSADAVVGRLAFMQTPLAALKRLRWLLAVEASQERTDALMAVHQALMLLRDAAVAQTEAALTTLLARLVGSLRACGASDLDGLPVDMQYLVRCFVPPKRLPRDSTIAPLLSALAEAVERRLGQQLEALLHHDDFKHLEAAWRGLHHLVARAEPDETSKIRFMPLAKHELAAALLLPTPGGGADGQGSAPPRDFDAQSVLYQKVHEEPFGQFGGEPFGLLVGDYLFDHDRRDVQLLQALGQLGAAAHAPFLGGLAPSFLQMTDFSQLSKPLDLPRLTDGPEYAHWRKLRADEASRHVGLAMPRMLARAPYRAAGLVLESFDLEETLDGPPSGDHRVWANAAYAMAGNIARAFKQTGWPVRFLGVASGGAVDGLPTFNWPGPPPPPAPVEAVLSDRMEAELARAGLMPLIHTPRTGVTAFCSAESLCQSPPFDDPEANAMARRAGAWPYLLACNRVVIHLKCLVRDTVGSFASAEQLAPLLNDWLAGYVEASPSSSSEADRAARPLAAASVVLGGGDFDGDGGDRPAGGLRATVLLQPHFQLEGLTAALRTVTWLPMPGNA